MSSAPHNELDHLRQRVVAQDAAFAQAAVGLAYLDADGRIERGNPNLYKLLELAPETAQHHSFLDFLDHSDGLRQVLRGASEHFTTEQSIRTAHGERRWVQVTVSLIRPGDGQPRSVFAVVTDVGGRERSESAFREAQALLERRIEEHASELQLVLDSVPVCISYIGPDRRYRRVNRYYEEMFGRPVNDIVGRTIEEVTGAEHYSIAAPHFARAITGEPARFRSVFTRNDGSRRRIEVSYTPDRSPAGDVRGLVAMVQDVTDRERAAEALAESEMRYRILTEVAPQIVWIGDPDGSINYTNQRWTDLTGLSLAETQGDGWARAMHPHDADRVLKRWKQAAARGVDYEVEIRFRRAADGLYRWHLARGLPLRDTEGCVVKWLGVALDIHDRRIAEAAADEHRQRLLTVTDNAAVSLFIMDERQQCVFMNPAAEALTGYTLADMQGRPLHDLVHHTYPDGRPFPIEECAIDRAFPENNREQGEEVFVHKDGHFYHVAYTASPIRQGAEVRGTVIEVRDITREKEAERALRESEERFRQLAESIREVFYISDLQAGRLLYVSPAFEEIWQQPADRLYEQRSAFIEAIHGDDRAAVFTAIEQQRGGERTEVTYRVVRRDGSVRWLWDRAFPVFDERGAVYRVAGIAEDVTERHQAEEALRAANAELEEFAFVASHDLQEPLRMINIYTQLLLRRFATETDEDTREYAGYISQGVHRAQRLISDLLSYSRIVHAEALDGRETADLNVSLEQALAMLARLIEETGTEIVCDPLPVVVGDEGQLAQVFQNLISNAMKYQRPGVRPLILIRAEIQGGEAVIRCEDQGIGFDPQYADRIFGLFKRLYKDEYPGTGLGLAICKRMIERSGGRIWAESRGEGQGAVFSFALPLAADRNAGRPEHRKGATARTGSSGAGRKSGTQS